MQLPDFKSGVQFVTRGSGVTSKFIATWTIGRTCVSGWGLPWVSHTACVVDSPFPADPELWVIESTSLSDLPDGIDGAQAHRLPDWLENYPGKVWHAPLAVDMPKPGAYHAYLWLKHEQQIDYDRAGAMRAASWLMRTFRPAKAKTVADTETHRGIYCTALYLYAVRYGGLIFEGEPRSHYPDPPWRCRSWANLLGSNERPAMRWTDAACWMILAVMLAALSVVAGCVTAPQAEQRADWPAISLALDDARVMVEGFRPVVEQRGRGESLDHVLATLDAAEAAVDRRMAGEAGSDDAAVEAIKTLLDVSGAIIAEWPNPTERAIASAAHVGLRVTLRTAHRRIEARRQRSPPVVSE